MSRRQILGPFVLAAMIAVALSACVPHDYPGVPRNATSGGQTQDQLDAKLSTIPGLNFTVAHSYKISGSYGYALRLQEDYTITDAPALIDFLVESAWSVRDAYEPHTGVAISIVGVPCDELDLVAAAEQSGWLPDGTTTHPDISDCTSDDAGDRHVDISLDTNKSDPSKNGAAANRDRLGEWPGAAPTAPTGVTKKRS